MSYAKSNFQQLNTDEFIIGDAPFNARCHLNSVQHYKNGTAAKVIACYAIDNTDNSQCIHFINQLSSGKYQDNTWGWRYKQHSYYIIKEVSEKEMDNIWDLLSQLKKSFIDINSSSIERKLSRIDHNNAI